MQGGPARRRVTQPRGRQSPCKPAVPRTQHTAPCFPSLHRGYGEDPFKPTTVSFSAEEDPEALKCPGNGSITQPAARSYSHPKAPEQEIKLWPRGIVNLVLTGDKAWSRALSTHWDLLRTWSPPSRSVMTRCTGLHGPARFTVQAAIFLRRRRNTTPSNPLITQRSLVS